MNIIYLGYNILKTDYKTYFKFVNTCSKIYNKRRTRIVLDSILCLLKFDTRLLDFFYFKFYNSSIEEKIEHVSVWDMYQFQKRYNDKRYTKIIKDKIEFRHYFQAYFNYDYITITKNNFFEIEKWVRNRKLNKFIAKQPLGTVGKGVSIHSVSYSNNDILVDNINFNEVLHKLFTEGYLLIEEMIDQHPVMSRLYSKSVNTIRVVTFVNNFNEVDIWATLLRIGVDKSVDNFDAGGISAAIDVKSGIVIRPAVSKNPFQENVFEYHPITNEKIIGLQIPYWQETIEMVICSAKLLPNVRTIGWDVAITKSGPTLIEGNDNWDKTHYELTSGECLKNRIKNLLIS